MKRLLVAAFLALLVPAISGAADAPAAAAAKKPAAAAKVPAKGAPAALSRPAPAGKAFDTIRKRGTLLVGTAWNIPWAMRDPQGEWLGFEIDIARQLAADLGVEMNIVRMPFNEFTDALASGKIDVVVAGYSITPQRALVFPRRRSCRSATSASSTPR
jgi:polar amino acid transport system substrate-binding protein